MTIFGEVFQTRFRAERAVTYRLMDDVLRQCRHAQKIVSGRVDFSTV